MGKLISAEYAPVTDFREARCRAHHETRCSRLGCCRFLHFRHIPKAVKRRVAREMYRDHHAFGARSPDRGRGGGGKRDPKGGGKGGKGQQQLALEGPGGPRRRRTHAQEMPPEDLYDPEMAPPEESPRRRRAMAIQDAQ